MPDSYLLPSGQAFDAEQMPQSALLGDAAGTIAWSAENPADGTSASLLHPSCGCLCATANQMRCNDHVDHFSTGQPQHTTRSQCSSAALQQELGLTCLYLQCPSMTQHQDKPWLLKAASSVSGLVDCYFLAFDCCLDQTILLLMFGQQGLSIWIPRYCSVAL